MTQTPLSEAVQHLQRGAVVAFPTETVYGMGADAENPDAVRDIFRLKQRPANIPLTIHLGTRCDPSRSAHIDERAQALMDAFWPGPLTLILPKTENVPDIVVASGPTVGLRMPSHPLCIEFLNAFGRGVAAPSANRHQNISPTTAEHVYEEFGNELAAILDGGPCTVGLESTVLSLAHDTPTAFRLGALSLARIEACIGVSVKAPVTTGKRYKQTQTIQVCTRAEWTQENEYTSETTVVSMTPDNTEVRWIHMPQTPKAYQAKLYAVLRTLRDSETRQIIVEPVPDTPEWSAIANRLARLV